MDHMIRAIMRSEGLRGNITCSRLLDEICAVGREEIADAIEEMMRENNLSSSARVDTLLGLLQKKREEENDK